MRGGRCSSSSMTMSSRGAVDAMEGGMGKLSVAEEEDRNRDGFIRSQEGGQTMNGRVGKRGP